MLYFQIRSHSEILELIIHIFCGGKEDIISDERTNKKEKNREAEPPIERIQSSGTKSSKYFKGYLINYIKCK
jgi:hypothetical protein